MSLKVKVKRETESLLVVAQNNAIRTNYIKTRIDKTQQNRKCRLYGNHQSHNQRMQQISTERVQL